MKKIRPNKEKGITLVALIVTIVILVILLAISIKVAVDNGIISISIKGTENYAKSKYEELDRFDNISERIDKAVNDIKSRFIIKYCC